MRIIDSSVNVAAERVAFNQHSTSLSVSSRETAQPDSGPAQEKVTLSAPTPAQGPSTPEALGHPRDWRIALLRRLLEAFTGKPVRVSEFDGAAAQQALSGAGARPPPAITLSATETITEFESARFTADGIVQTADGREIAFSAELALTRSYRSERSITLQSGAPVRQARDPLVINLDGSADQLSAQTFTFDLDADGRTEQLSRLRQGSGFLALDKDGNGRVDDGNELFGPRSGNGFADLAQHDVDGNGWIDEGDAVWGKLSVWLKDDAGNDRMLSLAELGIGAIYLGSARADFMLTDGDNRALGQVRASGVWLGEHGDGGAIQHIDLMV
ncbi:hypothetical protein N8I74_11975 [Chitiniphilus purpureus]|uniref:VCBS repeat-containing protein n=1 Tax=Chitiniphilus purpureus TaxID=2981137 RepID=A0ABY6DI89_9NEIS|nr:hypothetical protein [Chitiniphilus sp. CD1]UXY14041.1 hypothetical protein N8I74_11975 [Chitiniphilus sp. CD1]